jgi:predicted transcriptional regulator
MPAHYRARYNLQSDYPMAASNYSEQRRAILGLDRKPAARHRSPTLSPLQRRAANSYCHAG